VPELQEDEGVNDIDSGDALYIESIDGNRVKILRCRIDGCRGAASGASSLCRVHIVEGMAEISRMYPNGRPVKKGRKTRVTKLYALKVGDFVKIGVADDLKARIACIQTNCPLEVELLGYVNAMQSVESAIHGLIASERARGEWFHFRGIVLVVVTAMQRKDHLMLEGLIGLPSGFVGVEQELLTDRHRIDSANKFLETRVGVEHEERA